MKRSITCLLLLLLAGCIFVSGCARREDVVSTPVPGEAPAAALPAAEPEVTPEPTPEPTPLPFDDVAAGRTPGIAAASGYEAAAEALLSCRKEQTPDFWETVFVGEDAEEDDPLCAVRSRDAYSSGESAVFVSDRLYVLSGLDLVILSADGSGEEEILSRTRVGYDWTGSDTKKPTPPGQEKRPLAVFTNGKQLSVVSDWFGYSGRGGNLSYASYTAVDIYDVSDPRNPKLVTGFGQDGAVCRAELLGDTLCLLTDCPVFDTLDASDPESFVPGVYLDGKREILPAEKLLVPEWGNDDGITLIGSYDLPSASNDAIALIGMSGDVYAEGGCLYMVSNGWHELLSRTKEKDGQPADEYAVTACSDVFQFSADRSGIALRKAATVRGALSGSDALDLRGGVLRCAGKMYQGYYSTEGNNIVLRTMETGAVVSRLTEDLERISAAEFLSDGAPVCWIAFVDGSVALTDEAGATVLLSDETGETKTLSETVLADAILPWGDQGYMAFYRAQSDTLTLTLRDAELKELSSRTFGSDHSNTLENKASYYSDADANLFGFAADDSYCLYGCGEEDDIVFRKDVFLNDWAWYSRACRVKGILYVADTAELFAFNADTLEEINSIAW